MQVKWTRTALSNLNDLAEYVAKEDPQVASDMVSKIVLAVDKLLDYPGMGRPGRVPGTRELLVPGVPYIIPYRVKDDFVEILRVFHAKRRWPKGFC